MNRRGFFTMLAALCAAPAALLRSSKAEPMSDVQQLSSSEERRNRRRFEELEANPKLYVEPSHYHPHVCEWGAVALVHEKLPERAAERCTVCGDVRLRIERIEVDEFYGLGTIDAP